MSRIIPPGSMVLTPSDAAVLYQFANLWKLRKESRIGNSHLNNLLNDLSVCAFRSPDTVSGILPRHDAASEDSDLWTVRRVAKAVGLSERTVRLDCQRGGIPATKQGTSWVIDSTAAATYIRGKRKQ